MIFKNFRVVKHDEPYPEIVNPYDRAKERNAFVVESKPGLLMCDLDTQDSLDFFMLMVTSKEPGKKPKRPYLITTSPGGRAHGYVIDPSAQTVMERITKQLELGSAPIREKMSKLKLLKHMSSEICLFETEKEYYRATHWIWERLKTNGDDLLSGIPASTEEIPF